MRAREGQAAVAAIADQGQRRVLALAEALAYVLHQHGVERQQQFAGGGVGHLAGERSDPALHHQHDQTGAETVAGDVADADPAAVVDRDDVVVVAADLGGGVHGRGDLEARHVDVVREDGGLDAGGDLHLFFQALPLGDLPAGGFLDEASDQTGALERARHLLGERFVDHSLAGPHLEEQAAQRPLVEEQRLDDDRGAPRDLGQQRGQQ